MTMKPVVRIGRETSSSSMHTFCIGDLNRVLKYDNNGDYGWNWNQYHPVHYILTQARYNLPTHYWNQLVEEYIDDENERNILLHSSIDHQSIWDIVGTTYHKMDFFTSIIKFCLDNNIVVQTGTDNEESHYQSISAMRDNLKTTFGKYMGMFLMKLFKYKVYVTDTSRAIVAIADKGLGSIPVKVRFPHKRFGSVIYPEQVEIKITNKCSGNCHFCSENSNKDGGHADVSRILRLLRSVAGHTAEVCFGGGNPFEYPHLGWLCSCAMNLNILPAVTAKDTHFLDYKHLAKLLPCKTAFGVSMSDPIFTAEVLREFRHHHGDIAVHVINGIHTMEQLQGLINVLEELGWSSEDRDDLFVRIVVLGFKRKGRAKKLEFQNTIDVEQLMSMFPFVSFDTLAIKQLNIKDKIDSKLWDAYYQGKETEYSLYYDAVTNQFKTSSVGRPITENSPFYQLYNVLTVKFNYKYDYVYPDCSCFAC